MSNLSSQITELSNLKYWKLAGLPKSLDLRLRTKKHANAEKALGPEMEANSG